MVSFCLMANSFSPIISPQFHLPQSFKPHFFLSFTNFATFTTTSSPHTILTWPNWVHHSHPVFVHINGAHIINDIDNSGPLVSLFRVLGIDEKESEVILCKNPNLGFMPIESIRGRIRGLQSIGLNEVALSRLILKYPDILTAEGIDVFIQYVHGLGERIDSLQIERLLLGTAPKFLVGFDKKAELLVENGTPREKIAHILNNVNIGKVVCLKSSEELQRMLTFLSRYGAVGIIAKRPSILNYDLDTQLVPRIGFLQKLSRGDTVGVGEVLNRLPAIVTYTLEHVQSHVEFFKSFAGLSDQEIFKIMVVYPNIISTSRERKLHPRIEFLKECGMDSLEIYGFLIKAPLFLGLSFEKNLAHKLALLVKIGYVPKTKDLAMALGAATRTSSENLQEVISLFLSYGFTGDDIVAMSQKHFQILQYNPRSLEEKMEYLVEEMDREIGELLSFPAFLGYNLDKRIKHRYELKKKIIGEEMSINKLLSVSSEKFSKTKKHLVIVGRKSNDEVSNVD